VITWRASGEGSPLLLLHSVGLDSGAWDPIIEPLARAHRVVCIDLRGHGASEAPPGPYTLEELAKDVLEVADACALDRFAIAGVSLGGLIALWIAVHTPSRLSSMIVSNSAARIGSVESWEERMRVVRERGMAGLAEVVVPRILPAQATAIRGLVAERLARTSAIGYLGCCAALRDADLRSAVPKIRTPALFVAGEVDLATPPEQQRWLHEQVPGSAYEELPGVGHLANLEAPAHFARLVLDFIGGGHS